jgi:hypothetical protein
LLKYFLLRGFVHAGPYGADRWNPTLIRYVCDVAPGHFCAWHYPWTQELSDLVRARGAAVVFLYRDPRAQVVSRMHFIMNTPHHPWHRMFVNELKTDEDRLCRAIEGFGQPRVDFSRRSLTDVDDPDGRLSQCPLGLLEQYPPFEGWLTDPSCLPVRFEDVVGPAGGSDGTLQLRTLEKLMSFTGTGANAANALDDPQVVAGALFDPQATTFRVGRVDAWRDEFTPRVEQVFLRVLGDRLARWGYDV